MTQSASSNEDLIIGVDGGGTKTVAWIARLDQGVNAEVLGRGQAGPSNPRSVGFEAAQSAIQKAIAAAFRDANRSSAPVTAAWLALAGAGRESEQKRLETWAQHDRRLAHRVRVSGDMEPILAAASTQDWGMVLIGGTGSLAWGRNSHGDSARTGGWGHLIGDEGSAYTIAISAIRNAMQSADGRLRETLLLDRLFSYFEASSPENLIEIIYSPEMTRNIIAGCAQLVFNLVDDPIVKPIIDQAANDLANMIVVLARKLDLPVNGYPLAMAGSLLVNQEPFRAAILSRLTIANVSPGSVAVVPDPVVGAVALANRLAKLSGE